MKKKTIDIIVRSLFLLCLIIFFTPPSAFYPFNILILPTIMIIAVFGSVWCAYRVKESKINIIFIILYILFLALIGMTG